MGKGGEDPHSGSGSSPREGVLGGEGFESRRCHWLECGDDMKVLHFSFPNVHKANTRYYLCQ